LLDISQTSHIIQVQQEIQGTIQHRITNGRFRIREN